MKTYFALILFTLALFVSGRPAMAQEIAPAQESAQKTVEEELNHLIGTLDDPAAREDFLKNLKILRDARTTDILTQEKAPEPLTEKIGVRSLFEKFIDSYESFLNRYALSSSLIHQMVGSILVILCVLGLYVGVRGITHRILGFVDRLSVKIGIHLTRFGLYTRFLQVILRLLILGVGVYTLGKIWDVMMVEALFEGDGMRGFLSTIVTFLLVACIAAFIWEAVGVYLSYILKMADDHNQTRVKTLLPIVRNIVMSIFAVLFGLILLSELGINVAPLLAGAGVIGVAIGFGAQSMVKDFLTGFTIVLEDIIRVGDVANLGGVSGVVEKITLRKVQLRDMAGTVYTIPFSAITIIQNLTKDFSFYVMDIGVAYHTDIDHVIDVLRKVDGELRTDPAFFPLCLEPIDIMGVDRFAENAVIIKARLKTLPLKQWVVGREYNRRMKMAFDKAGIEIPFPQRVVTVRNEPVPQGFLSKEDGA
jgi:moderate conductance mechanosensitive channel